MSEDYAEAKCPQCGCQERLDISVMTWARLLPDKADVHEAADHDLEWDSDDVVVCRNCNWSGRVIDVPGLGHDASEPEAWVAAAKARIEHIHAWQPNCPYPDCDSTNTKVKYLDIHGARIRTRSECVECQRRWEDEFQICDTVLHSPLKKEAA